MAPANQVLVKLRATGALTAAASSKANVRPLFETQSSGGVFGLDAAPRWYVAELPDSAATPWDLAHAQVAGQLGIAESDVLFAEPDLTHDIYRDDNEAPRNEPFAATVDCVELEQDGTHNKPRGNGFAWHLGDEFSQLRSARNAVSFSAPHTRIAHIDTGYQPSHRTAPKRIVHQLERNFVERDGVPGSAEDPNNRRLLLDNSGHGTGTISILAGGAASSGEILGGAPDAEILPLRVADSVVLLRTSALARALDYAIQQRCDVITMSLGGLPSQAWAEAVDRVYEAGICFCAAAGNHKGALPPRVVVYPARYPRVIAVTGVMANGKPYEGLAGALEGSFGPTKVMEKAIAAYTPNVPWARFGCDEAVRLNGEGTSAATPQVAAAAALWIERYKNVLPRNFQRVEAVRHALFMSAFPANDALHFGNGFLRALAALDIRPLLHLPQSARSSNSFAFLRLVTGLGITEVPPREEMFNVELAQRWLINDELQRLLPDPDTITTLQGDLLRQFMDAVIADEGASVALRKHVATRYPVANGRAVPPNLAPKVVPAVMPACDVQPAVRNPAYRRLRVYAVDPSLSTRLATARINEVALQIRWEENLGVGPTGAYLRVDDVDATGKVYDPVNLNDPRLLAQDGWAPSEGNAQFHQQMVYAVAMKTIEHFEKALGRPVLWRHLGKEDKNFVARLVIKPHALQQANAFYSPSEVALKFGYFQAPADNPGELMPGSRIYSCLSHDIIAHETTHAILDGMYRRFNEPTNLDVLALHEGFADIVALLQHFTMQEVVEDEIARTRGDLEAESLLGKLAVQFGVATGGRGALRNAIGAMENGVWKRFVPDPTDLQRRQTPHARGAVLVAAVFDAFLAIYQTRTADLLRINTGGTGVLPTGSIHPDLVHRLAEEASKTAGHVLGMCIRALDYLPPVDVTFFEYLRAIITADFDHVGDDRFNYRVAFVEAFRRRAIYPLNLDRPTNDTLRTLSVDTLRWEGIQVDLLNQTKRIVDELKQYADDALYISDRARLFAETRQRREELHERLEKVFQEVPGLAAKLGLDLEAAEKFEVHELRRSMRVCAAGRFVPQIIVSLTQKKKVPEKDGTPAHTFRGGSTLVVDLSVPEVKYCIIKNISAEDRQKRTAAFVREAAADPLRALFFSPDREEPFAALHALADEGF
jgi:hypothetical protein